MVPRTDGAEPVYVVAGEIVQIVAKRRKLERPAVRNIDSENPFEAQRACSLIRHGDIAVEVLGILYRYLLHRFADGLEGDLASGVPGRRTHGGRLTDHTRPVDVLFAIAVDVVTTRKLGFAEHCQRYDTEDVVAVVRQLMPRIGKQTADSEAQTFAREDRDVEIPLDLAVDIPRGAKLFTAERSVVIDDPPGHEGKDVVAPTRHADRVGLLAPGPEHVLYELTLEDLVRLQVQAVQLVDRGCLRSVPGESRVGFENVGVVRDALFDANAESGSALGTALREDLNHAGGGLAPVERGRGGSLQHLDAFDGLRVYVVQL